MSITLIKHIIAVSLIILGATGLISPDSSTNEELIDTLAASIGAAIELFTTRIDRGTQTNKEV